MSKKQSTIYNIRLNKDELNTIINSLSKLPFQEVYKIIEKIHLEVKTNENHTKKS